ncbi:MAG TPA: zinc-dependent alcohol dehydrogenase family protein [Pyrinomonadaceae bacterium]
MKAAVYEKFQAPPAIQNLPDPIPPQNGVVLRTGACGICRSDWHGWMGNDPDIVLPHVPGHELAGTVEDVGESVKNWKKGDRVTLPFVCSCGTCPQCAAGEQQICDFQFQPGFTAWGGFAEFVAVDYADTNLVRLPDEIDFLTASSLGCRFTTSFRAVAAQGRAAGGEWVAVHGAGGVGLSAVMIAAAFGANVVAIDIDDEKLAFAEQVGACRTINSRVVENTIEAVKEITKGGAHVSIDAFGSPETCFNSIASLRKRGRHVQVGIMEAAHHKTAIPMDLVIARELEIRGSHGMQAYKYAEMLEMIAAGKLRPEKLIGKTVSLEESLDELTAMNNFRGVGLTVIDRF